MAMLRYYRILVEGKEPMSNTDLKWKKSRFSEAGNRPNCVEVAEDGEQVLIRESEEPSKQIIASREDVVAFRDGIKAGLAFGDVGKFNVYSDYSAVVIQLGDQEIRTSTANYLVFTAGVVAGDLDFIEVVTEASA